MGEKNLLDKGASIEVNDKDGWTSLMRASQNGHIVVAKYIQDNAGSKSGGY